MKKKQKALHPLKTWWYNLPHKGFFVFQILIPLLFFILLIMAQSGISLFLWLILAILIMQFYLIQRYYGGRCVFHCVLLYLLFIYTGTALVLYSTKNETIMLISTILMVCALFSPIIPQLWRSTKHGRK